MMTSFLEMRSRARAAARPGDWLSLILDHHQYIEDQFAEARAAATAVSRKAAQQHLAAVLSAHAVAEETVIYPAMRRSGKQLHADIAYAEQAAVKQQLASLALLEPSAPEYLRALEQIRSDVGRHVCSEESAWFMALRREAPEAEQAVLTRRYPEEFDRLLGRGESVSTAYRRASESCIHFCERPAKLP